MNQADLHIAILEEISVRAIELLITRLGVDASHPTAQDSRQYEDYTVLVSLSDGGRQWSIEIQQRGMIVAQVGTTAEGKPRANLMTLDEDVWTKACSAIMGIAAGAQMAPRA